MTRKEEAKLLRLETENKHLRESIDKHMEIYREQLYELVEMRARIEMIEFALGARE